MNTAKEHNSSAAKTDTWQRRLLPFMIGSIIFMGIFFFIISLINFYYLHGQVQHTELVLDPIFKEYESKAAEEKEHLGRDYWMWKTLVFLEQDVVKRRYHRANSAVLARIWTRYLGFVTGMILALVGAVFILGKLQEPPTKLEADTSALKMSLYTSSPGIVLAVLGSMIMAIALAIPFEIETRDRATYAIQGKAVQDLPPPGRWDEKTPFDVGKKETELFGIEPSKPLENSKGQSPPSAGRQ